MSMSRGVEADALGQAQHRPPELAALRAPGPGSVSLRGRSELLGALVGLGS